MFTHEIDFSTPSIQKITQIHKGNISPDYSI